MRIEKSERGFEFLYHPRYLDPHDDIRVVSQSSAIGNYDDSMEKPGSSFLWVGDELHLNRDEITELRDHLTTWLETGLLNVKPEPEPAPKLTPGQKKAYLSHKGTRCPYCESERIDGGDFNWDIPLVQEVNCLDCERSWGEVLEPVDVIEEED